MVKMSANMSNVVLEEYEMLGDSKYRSFVTAVDKSLKTFEYSSEWADLISALGKLNKVLLSHMKFNMIPRRITISKRLAQCMHPALPSGVHLKALETYDIIFKSIGTVRLSQELFIYSAGLFPLLAHAAMNVKPVLLTVYETHFVALAARLRPGLNGFLIGVLPGLEEGSDYFERTDALLKQVCESVEQSYFYGCLWRCVLTNPSVRLPAITFIILHYNKKLSMEDQLHVIGTDIDAMVQGMCAALQDNSVLVQRCALDLLLIGFPLHNSQLLPADVVRVVQAAIAVVLRRDMSLNRRLFAWLLGLEASNTPMPPEACSRESVTSTDSIPSVDYFDTYSKKVLLAALGLCFQGSDNFSWLLSSGAGGVSGSPSLWPYRILMSLLDRPEISCAILDDILIQVFRSLYEEVQVKTNTNNSLLRKRNVLKSGNTDPGNNSLCTELIKTANLLFGTLETSYLWEYIGRLFRQSCQSAESGHSEQQSDVLQSNQWLENHQNSNMMNGSLEGEVTGSQMASIQELCTLVEFLLDVVNVETYTDTPTEHLPELLSMLGSLLTQYCHTLTCEEISTTLQLCSKILSKVQPASYTSVEPALNSSKSGPVDDQDTVWNLNICVNPDNENYQNADMPESLFCISVDTKTDKLQGDCASGHCFLTKCMASFQNFLKTFVSVRLIQDPECAVTFFRNFVLTSNSEAEREGQLSWLLQQCLSRSCSGPYEGKSFPLRSNREEDEQTEVILSKTVMKLQSSPSLSQAFSVICQFYTELAAFPVFVVDSQQHPGKQLSSVSCQHLPSWLQLLLTVACFAENVGSSSDAALCALRTVLDLVALTHTVLISSNHSSQKSSPSKDEFSSAPVTSVVHVPIITPSELEYIQNKTRFFSLSAARLWRGMTDAKQQLRCVELLQQLHNLDADGSACDYVICQAMAKSNLQEQLEAQKKFCILWHLTRDITLKSHSGKCRLFDRPLFLMLDHLRQESGGQRSVGEGWLSHCLQRGDVGRILEPLLLILLHPDTARVSVQHVNIYCQRKAKEPVTKTVEPEQNVEAQVYAISSVGGNVIYHVSDESKQSSQRSSPERRILALTTVVGTSDKGTQVVTSYTKMDNYNIPCSHDRNLSDRISVFVNPFGSMTSLGSDSNPESSIPDLSAVRRIDTRLITRTYFDDIDSDNDDVDDNDKKSEKCVDIVDKVVTNVCSEPDQSAKDDEFSVEEFVRDLLDNVISSAIEQSLNTGVPEDEQTFPPMEDLLRDFQSTREQQQKEYLEHSEDSSSGRGEPAPLIHPLHTYMLLYSQVFDSKQVLYALSSLKSIVVANPRLSLWSLSTTSLSHAQSPRGSDLQVLLSRHRKSVFGNNFHGQLSSESVTTHRSSMLIEVVVLVCLYYVRSFYPSLPQMRLTENEVLGNQAVRLLCVEVLALLFAELVGIVKDSGKSFASYLNDLLSRCKAQKILLHCLIASVYNNNSKETSKSADDCSFSKVVVDYNEKNFEKEGSTFQDTLEVKLLQLLSKLIMLEETVSKLSGADKEGPGVKPADKHDKSKPKFSPGNVGQLTSVKYIQGCPIPGQPIFLTAILSALRQVSRAHLHSTWLSLVMSTLPFAGPSLTQLVISVVSQLSLNLDNLAKASAADTSDLCWPPDYLVTTVEGLTTICHFCLLDSPSVAPVPQPPHLQAVGVKSSYASGVNASQIIANLLHVFSPSELQKDFCLSGEGGAMVEVVLSVRRTLLSNLPRILATFCSLWRAAVQQLGKAPKHMGSPKAVKQHILGFLSPISVHYGSHFMAAVAVVWNDYKQKAAIPTRKILPCWSEEQLQLVELISAIKVLPIESVVQTVRQVIRQPPPTSRDDNQKRVPLEVSMLQFFLAYVQHTAGHLLVESFQALLSLWRDGLQLTALPLVQFYLLALLHEFVQKAPMLEDKKDQRDLQEVSQKLIDMCSTIAGACLEQTNWLRRNLAVKPGPQQDLTDLDQETEPPAIQNDTNFPVPSASNAQYSVQALQCLAEFLAPVIDVVYVSEEKEKVVYPLNNIMYYVTPYLRNHSCHNVPSFRACSQLLASISDYQYTRKAWKKDAFDLLLEPAFFQMDLDCMPYWRAIIDHLMTHDKTTFRDFLARVSLPQSGSLNIFSSKEQEYEQRVQLLKRLAFVLFCSEPDQYQKYMPEIQERLAECLRLPQVPSIQVNVFLCFRVLLLRMSADNMTSLWPTIITEMVQVFLQMEQELSTETEQFSSHLQRLSLLDSSWVVNTSNGLHAHNHPAWLQLYLAACKLLDMVVCLPADMLPQFQMYRWAFVGDSPPVSSEEELREDQEELRSDEPHFVPHIARLANLMKLRAPQGEQSVAKGTPLLRLPSIQSMFQLQGFFNALARTVPAPQWGFNNSPSRTSKIGEGKLDIAHNIQDLIKLLEQVLEMDFVEPQSAS